MHPSWKIVVPTTPSHKRSHAQAAGARALASRLPVAAERERVVLAPGGGLGGVVVLGALAEATVLLALRGKATSLAALVDGVADPVDAGVAADRLVRGVDEDDLLRMLAAFGVAPSWACAFLAPSRKTSWLRS